MRVSPSSIDTSFTHGEVLSLSTFLWPSRSVPLVSPISTEASHHTHQHRATFPTQPRPVSEQTRTTSNSLSRRAIIGTSSWRTRICRVNAREELPILGEVELEICFGHRSSTQYLLTRPSALRLSASLRSRNRLQSLLKGGVNSTSLVNSRHSSRSFQTSICKGPYQVLIRQWFQAPDFPT